ncbi:MAG: hypothetical protein KDN22_28680 [Verrucomicrobiae bacterium]|nr:hypothetical protein [Verrucomicrobiae bacterium]
MLASLPEGTQAARGSPDGLSQRFRKLEKQPDCRRTERQCQAPARLYPAIPTTTERGEDEHEERFRASWQCCPDKARRHLARREEQQRVIDDHEQDGHRAKLVEPKNTALTQR